jgi:simple sugar transport system permease protein
VPATAADSAAADQARLPASPCPARKEAAIGETVQRPPDADERPLDMAQRNDAITRLRRAGRTLVRQRESTVFMVVVLLVLYFRFLSPASTSYFSGLSFSTLTQDAAPIIIIAMGEVLLLICGEIDLSPGFVYTFAPFLMHYLIDFYGVPVIPAILISLLMGLTVGWVNGFLTVTLGLPSFISTLGTGFILLGLTDTTSHATAASIPPSAAAIGKWIGGTSYQSVYSYTQIIWAIVFVAIFHVVLTRTRWGLHTIAVGGNQLGAAEAGINVGRIKYGNFMITGVLGAFVGVQVAFFTQTIDPTAGGYQPMFYSVAAAVLGGTAMLGGSGTIIGAFLGSVMLAVLTEGFLASGVSANPLAIIFGGAILIAMVANLQLARLREVGRTRR